MLRHLPNLLSALRLLLAPIAAWAILSDHDTAALAVFAVAGVSDAADGYIARRWGFASRFGAWLDPAADKLLMLMCFVALWRIAVVPLWLAALVIARDLALAAGWVFARLFSFPIRFEALTLGKASTAVQIIYIGLLLLMLAFGRLAPRLALAGAFTVAAFTVLSGGAYGLVLLRQLFAGRQQIS